jgi:hypothetical protein
VLWCLRRIYLWNRKLCVVVPEEMQASTFGTGSSVLWSLRRIYLWNRKLCVVVPEEDLPLEQEALCCGA